MVLFIISLLCSSAAAWSQEAQGDYRPLLQDGKTWNYECTHYSMDDQGKLHVEKVPYKEWIEGDTVINDKTYYRMHSSDLGFPVMSESFWREDDGRVYAYRQKTDTEMLMYDFNVKAGDIIGINGSNHLEIRKVDTLLVRGIKRARINVAGFAYWVEGIGASGLLAEPLGHEVSDGNVSQLLSCYEDGVCVFTSDDFNAPSIGDYRPLLQDGKEWHYRLEVRDEESPSIHITKNCREMVAGDTIVGGLHYFKHYRDSGDGELRSSDALWREEGRKVFVRWNRNAEEELMYDFGVKVGDKFPEDDYLQVSCIDTVLVNGQYFRRMNLGRAVWVEGVGSNWSLSYPFGQQTTDGKKRTLTACKENGVTIFTEEGFNAPSIGDYRPLLQDGKEWRYHYYNDFTGKDYYTSLTVAGDTIIDDKHYKQIVDVATGTVNCALREDGRRVYVNYSGHSGETLLYDFGLGLGDTFQFEDSSSATVVSVDTVMVGDRAFRALDVRIGNESWPNWWVEGVGSEFFLTTNYFAVGNYYQLSSCLVNGETIFTLQDFQTALGIHEQPYKYGQETPSAIYNLHGHRLTGKPTKGVYIEDGRKMVGK